MYGNGETARTEGGSSDRELDFGVCEIALGHERVQYKA
jgi:hypothetical protein